MSPAHAVRQPPPEPRRRGMTLVACGAVFGMVVPSVTALAEASAPDPRVDTTPIAAPEQTAQPSATVSVPLTILPADEPVDGGKGGEGASEAAELPQDVTEAARTAVEVVEPSEERPAAAQPVATTAAPTTAPWTPPVCVEPDPLCETAADHSIPTTTPPTTTAPATSTAPETTTAPSSQPETTAPEPTGATGLVDDLLSIVNAAPEEIP